MVPRDARSVHRAWAHRISALIRTAGIEAFYQPIVNLRDLSVVAFEALARPLDGGPSEPIDGMFDTAKSLGLLRDLDWVCRRAAMEGGNLASRSHPLFVNVSLPALLDPVRGVDQMMLLCHWSGRLPTDVFLEITEHALARDRDPVGLQAVLKDYRASGFRFSIDDAGIGRPALDLLTAISPEYIKIAGGLIANLDSTPARTAIVAIVSFAETEGCGVIAEGIDSDDALRSIRDLGVSFGQGYRFGRPARHRLEEA
jgi:EAL domain-containing protein (putative c-di-GMP-specific phosphodiesterase class I)